MVHKYRQPLPMPAQALQELLRLPSQLALGQFPVQNLLQLPHLAAYSRLQNRQRLGPLLEPSLAPLAIGGKELVNPLDPLPGPACPAGTCLGPD